MWQLSYHLFGVYLHLITSYNSERAQWLSGKMLDSRPRGRGFESHKRHSLSKTHFS